ncbi:hypothetical protein FNV43_RR00540 [Rhamnella rubrinervis]|uniref:non-specific serine/threonine protein kinase n=1 Tax=Rhamnella rubrinervis TaxID=2594499 RepID=A0A8K0HPS1_9ROSA|nr:hypothetical protein FNV43_RR00540 [Rhamnella rubrinervis]
MKLHEVNTLLGYWPIYLYILSSINLLGWKPTITTAKALGNETDALALLEFKKGIAKDPFNMLSSWNDSAHFCKWHGISCSKKHQRVVNMDLHGLKLRGSMSPHIGNLSFLRIIDLSNNSFYGEIPWEVGRLFRLQGLYLTNNTFTGQIPTQLSNRSKLEVIEFGRNKLMGKIPGELSSLTKLYYLQLGANNLTGSIPPSIGNLSSLEHLSAPYNNLVGSIPDDIGHLKKLSILAVGANGLTGMIPSSFYNISSITIISTASNRLNGSLPSNIGLALPNLQWLAISRNEFSGPIPLSLTNASKLQALTLSTNNFVGAVPSNLGDLIDLWWLGFGTNNLGSNSTDDLEFLPSLKNCSQLQILDFGNNHFGGVLPAAIANLSTQLSQLYFDGNQIFGVIPVALEKYINLNVLNMESNFFNGHVPSSFGKFQKMEGISFSSNRLSGPIPSSFGNLTQLTELYLSENELEGSIPTSIGGCKNLLYLDISQNNLTGAIPKQVADLSLLSLLLNLSHNSLTGNLPVELGNLKALNMLDLSENKLSGYIPGTIGGCISLVYLNLQGNSFDGMIPSSLASLKSLEHLDLSRNNFVGNILKNLQDLPYLMYFNISFNDLEGEVPTRGVFQNASAISMIGNGKLCGGVLELQLPTCPIKGTKRGMSHALKVKLIIIVTCVALPILLLSFFLYWRRKPKEKSSSTLLTKDEDQHHIAKITYKMLYQATGGFSPNNLVGDGSFGSVYKGFLNQDERAVAVKVLKLQQKGASKSFMAECKALKNIRHRNLVKIITTCSSMDYHGNEFKALIFEFMENASLEEWLHQKSDGEDCSRNSNILQRLNIATDVASALNYLHHQCQTPIIHCDLKPSNVLLDTDMVAHVSDFGLARLLSTTKGASQNHSSTIGLKGSIGYAAPEYGIGGKASMQGDVYSYGILLLEMFTGKRPTDEMFKDGFNIHHFAKMGLPERLLQIVDPTLFPIEAEETATTSVGRERDEFDIEAQKESKRSEYLSVMDTNTKECLHSVLKIGLACSMESPKDRMTMEKVIRELYFVKNAFLGDDVNP